MFWLQIPTIEEVRGRLEKFESQLVNGVGGRVDFPIKYTDNDAPEGHQESYKLTAWAELVQSGPDCDGTRVTTFAIRAILDYAAFAPAEVYYHCEEQEWRDTIVGLLFQRFGFYQGKAAGQREEKQRWCEVMREIGKGRK